MNKKIVATLACRNNSKRLYAKPLQLLGTDTVLEYMIRNLKKHPLINAIVLAVSEAKGNELFEDIAVKHGIDCIFGDDNDVLGRLIKSCEKGNGDIAYRVTTESPFSYLEGLDLAVKSHISQNADYTAYGQLPDGVTFELINLQVLKESHEKGEKRHRSELCTLYINEHPERYKMNILYIDKKWQRPDYRLTIDYPEDLILCRKIISHFGDEQPIPYENMIDFLDSNPQIRNIVENLTDKNYVRFYH
jgi:spore coat polysaccharide biosynthesis protein SpsF